MKAMPKTLICSENISKKNIKRWYVLEIKWKVMKGNVIFRKKYRTAYSKTNGRNFKEPIISRKESLERFCNITSFYTFCKQGLDTPKKSPHATTISPHLSSSIHWCSTRHSSQKQNTWLTLQTSLRSHYMHKLIIAIQKHCMYNVEGYF